MLPGFRYVPFNDAGALEKAVTGATCAVMLEPIQGEGASTALAGLSQTGARDM